ncbi:MAG: hypothetical protein II135_09785, partial [Clostridia bacterium]|nr:hypothetical protein [Clostridia bacterium]
MAHNKKSSDVKKNSVKNNGAKKTNTKKAAQDNARGENTGVIRIIQFCIGLTALFLLFCYIFPGASGIVGKGIRTGLFGSFGVSAMLIPSLMILLAVFLKRVYDKGRLVLSLIWGSLSQLFLAVFCGVFSLERSVTLSASDLFEKSVNFRGGGVVGGGIAQLLRGGLGSVFTAIISALLFIVFICLTIGITPSALTAFIEKRVKSGAQKQAELYEEHKKKVAERRAEEAERQAEEELRRRNEQPDINIIPGDATEPIIKRKRKKAYDFDNEEPDIIPEKKKNAFDELLETEDEGVEEFVRKPAEIFLEDGILVERPVKVSNKPVEDVTPDEPVITPEDAGPADGRIDAVKEPVGTPVEELGKEQTEQPPKKQKPYRFPPLKLLSLPDGNGAGISPEEAKNNARKIVETLANFGITVSVENISCGPTITRYELRPAPGVRISRIGNLIDDLARVLASGGVRFESSIEGKDTVGIEVPNKSPFTVNIRTLIDTDTFRNAKSKVFCALGVDVSNEPTFLDIQKMPHMIIAGATGMGKSVCINSLIVSILYRATPDEVKLIMIDPKKVEFAPYIGIPHLLVPVITDMKKAAGALNWLVQEMERRYDLIEATGCRNIFGYNDLAKNDPEMEK